MAAFCACCGAEITLKAESCPDCGAPRHGMVQSDIALTRDVQTNLSQETKFVTRRSVMSKSNHAA